MSFPDFTHAHCHCLLLSHYFCTAAKQNCTLSLTTSNLALLLARKKDSPWESPGPWEFFDELVANMHCILCFSHWFLDSLCGRRSTASYLCKIPVPIMVASHFIGFWTASVSSGLLDFWVGGNSVESQCSNAKEQRSNLPTRRMTDRSKCRTAHDGLLTPVNHQLREIALVSTQNYKRVATDSLRMTQV